MVVPPKHPKMIIFSGKTHGFVGEKPTILGVAPTSPSRDTSASVVEAWFQLIPEASKPCKSWNAKAFGEISLPSLKLTARPWKSTMKLQFYMQAVLELNGTPKNLLHPGRLTWNLKMMVWFRWFSFSIGWLVGSILIFRGVPMGTIENYSVILMGCKVIGHPVMCRYTCRNLSQNVIYR